MPELLFVEGSLSVWFLFQYLRAKPGEPGRILCLFVLVGWLALLGCEFFFARDRVKRSTTPPIRIDVVLFVLPMMAFRVLANRRLRKGRAASHASP